MGNDCHSEQRYYFNGGQIFVEIANKQIAFVAGQVIYGFVHVN